MSEPDDYAEDAIGGTTAAEDDAHLAECLAVLKQKYDAGNKAAVLMAVYQCVLMRKPLPEWLRQAFIETYESATRFEIRSWDEAFGSPQKDGAHLDTRKEYAELRYAVAVRIALRAPDEKLTPDFFDKIGDELGIGKNKASDAYYKFGGKELHESIEPLIPFLREQLEKILSRRPSY